MKNSINHVLKSMLLATGFVFVGSAGANTTPPTTSQIGGQIGQPMQLTQKPGSNLLAYYYTRCYWYWGRRYCRTYWAPDWGPGFGFGPFWGGYPYWGGGGYWGGYGPYYGGGYYGGGYYRGYYGGYRGYNYRGYRGYNVRSSAVVRTGGFHKGGFHGGGHRR